MAETQLSETETLGIELGSEGTANILAEGFIQLAKLFKNKKYEHDEQKKIEQIESKMRLYKMIKNSKGELLLYLRQLDY